MTKITSVGVQNLRSLRNISPNVPITPITILLGKNSVGKSTFARIFPLLRQSSERRKRSPILWFGDLVDFGSLRRAVSEGSSDICFSFDVEMSGGFRGEAFLPHLNYWGSPHRSIQLHKAVVHLTLSENSENQSGHATKLTVELLGGSIAFELPDQRGPRIKILINGEEFDVENEDFLITSFQGDILPLLYFYEKKKNSAGNASWTAAQNPWFDTAAHVIHEAIHQNSSTTTARRIARQIPIGTVEEISAALPLIDGPQSWKNIRGLEGYRIYLAKRLHRALLAGHAHEMLQQVDNALSEYFSGVRYLKPLRATAERYYRRADLSVSEIDPEGRNLPIFLDSLPYYELKNFREWVKAHLDIDVHTVREGDQLMVMAKGPNDSKAFNIADMGFGISQVLPVAAQLWATRRDLGHSSKATVVVLEQPELHLHPEFQSRLADVLAGAISNSNIVQQQTTPALIVETHSQHLVNRLGQLIEMGRLNHSDVSILLFEADRRVTSSTTIRVSNFDENGILQNWPFGFFEPEV